MNTGNETAFDVVIVGGGQAGLAVAYYLRSRDLRFVLFDAEPEISSVWKSRWDSLTLFTPAQYSGLPGMEFPAARDVYPSKDDVASYLQSYVSAFDLPVRPNARVTSLRRGEHGYLVATDDEVFRASQVVVATGPFQVPYVPAMARGLDASVAQLHSAQYRSSAQLPEGPVLVVGGGNSGFQIAAELVKTRKLDLAVGTSMPALPQRLLGRDLFWWLSHLGVMRASVESRFGRRMAKRDALIGSSRRRLLRAGVTIRKRLERIEGTRAVFADGSHLDIGAVVWATGYSSDYSWIDVPGVLDQDGRVLHRRGVTSARGLLFVGLPWQHTRGSALLGFVRDDAEFIAGTIVASAEEEAAQAPSDAGLNGPATRSLSGAAMTHPPLGSESVHGTTTSEAQVSVAPIVWGLVIGGLQAASPLVFWWLDAATVYALGLAAIAAIYVGFAVADGRRQVIAMESAVATVFIVVAAAAITGSPWLLVLGFVGHGLKDLWQHRRQFVANTHWWPPFCLVIDWVVAAAIIVEILAGVSLH